MLLPTTTCLAISSKPKASSIFEEGTTLAVVNCPVDSRASICNIEGTGTVLDRASVRIAAGSFNDKSNLSVSFMMGTITFPDGKVLNSPAVQLAFVNTNELRQPIELVVPVYKNDAEKVVSCFSVNDDGSLSAMVSKPVFDEQNKLNQFSVFTFKSGLLVWIFTD